MLSHKKFSPNHVDEKFWRKNFFLGKKMLTGNLIFNLYWEEILETIFCVINLLGTFGGIFGSNYWRNFEGHFEAFVEELLRNFL